MLHKEILFGWDQEQRQNFYAFFNFPIVLVDRNLYITFTLSIQNFLVVFHRANLQKISGVKGCESNNAWIVQCSDIAVGLLSAIQGRLSTEPVNNEQKQALYHEQNKLT